MLVQFKCRGCGDCCRHYTALLTIYDCARISRATDLPLERFVDFYPEGSVAEVPDDLYLVTAAGKFVIGFKKNGGNCVFLTDNRCAIQTAKPPVCRLYPLDLRVSPPPENSLEQKVVKYTICNGEFDCNGTDFGDVESMYSAYASEYNFHKDSLAAWRAAAQALAGPGEFMEWLTAAICRGWPEREVC